MVTQALLDRSLPPPAAAALFNDLPTPFTCGALAMPGIEGEEPRVELRVAAATAWACLLARELHLVAARNRPGGSVPHFQGVLEKAQELGALRRDAADHQLDVVLGVPIELHPCFERPKLAVDARLGEAVFHRLLE